MLYVRAGYSLYRVPLHPVRDNSRCFHDCCSVTPVDERTILRSNFESVGLKILSGLRTAPNAALDQLYQLRGGRELNHQCGPLPLYPGTFCGPPPFCSCSRRSASALPVLTFKAPAPEVPLSSTSTQRPPVWLPVVGGIQTMCFPFFWPALACDAVAGFRSKFSCVD